MIRVRCIAQLLVTLLTFSSAQSSETLLNHVKLAGQTMSAMYMKSLSEGNDKYQDDLDLYKKQSHAALEQYVSEGGDQAVEFLKQWQGFSDDLKVVYSKDFGWDIEEWVRSDFRNYLSRVYQLTEQNKASYEKILCIVLNNISRLR